MSILPKPTRSFTCGVGLAINSVIGAILLLWGLAHRGLQTYQWGLAALIVVGIIRYFIPSRLLALVPFSKGRG
jgi:membrane-bound ClpP family serine protease